MKAQLQDLIGIQTACSPWRVLDLLQALRAQAPDAAVAVGGDPARTSPELGRLAAGEEAFLDRALEVVQHLLLRLLARLQDDEAALAGCGYLAHDAKHHPVLAHGEGFPGLGGAPTFPNRPCTSCWAWAAAGAASMTMLSSKYAACAT